MGKSTGRLMRAQSKGDVAFRAAQERGSVKRGGYQGTVSSMSSERKQKNLGGLTFSDKVTRAAARSRRKSPELLDLKKAFS